jgi:hypothetical protein
VPASTPPAPAAEVRVIEFCGQKLRTDATKVQCHSKALSDLEPLAQLPWLESLDLSQTRVADLSPLAGHTWIKVLRLDHTRVKDLSPLSQHASLTELYLEGTKVDSLTPVIRLPKLNRIEFRQTPVNLKQAVFEISQAPAIRMTDDQARLLALFRLIDRRPQGLVVQRHPNGMVRRIGLRKGGKKHGWWATFRPNGELIDEARYEHGRKLPGTQVWNYNRYNCVETHGQAYYFIGGCLSDTLTLTASERRAVLKRAEARLSGPEKDRILAEILSAALVDDATLRSAIGKVLAQHGVLSSGAAALLPSQEVVAQKLPAVIAPLGRDFAKLSSEDCSVLPSPASTLELACGDMVRCDGPCRELHAHLSISVTSAGWKLKEHGTQHLDMGRCGDCRF